MDPTPPVPPPPSSPPPPQLPKIPLDLDPRTFATMKWSAIWNAVGSIIESFAGFIAANFFIGGFVGKITGLFGASMVRNFPFGSAIKQAVWGAVYGAVFGFLISKFYPKIQQWNRQYLKGRLNTFFKLLFYPSLIGSIIAFFLTSVAGFAVGFMFLIVILIGFVLSSYVYAKMMTKYVGPLYPPPL